MKIASELKHLESSISCVLNRIHINHPKEADELTRIVHTVRLINAPYGGEWIPDDNSLHTHDWKPWDPQNPALIGFNKRISGTMELCLISDLATIAHEFGHAATRQKDMERRTSCIIPEHWLCEITADWYAYRWGFGREISIYRKMVDEQDPDNIRHRGPRPNQYFTLNWELGRITYYMTRNFVIHKIG